MMLPTMTSRRSRLGSSVGFLVVGGQNRGDCSPISRPTYHLAFRGVHHDNHLPHQIPPPPRYLFPHPLNVPNGSDAPGCLVAAAGAGRASRTSAEAAGRLPRHPGSTHQRWVLCRPGRGGAFRESSCRVLLRQLCAQPRVFGRPGVGDSGRLEPCRREHAGRRVRPSGYCRANPAAELPDR